MIPEDEIRSDEVRPIEQLATSQVEHRIVGYLTPGGMLYTGLLDYDRALRFAGAALFVLTEEKIKCVGNGGNDVDTFIGDRLLLAACEENSEVMFDDGSVEVIEWARKRALSGWWVYRMENFTGLRVYPQQLELPKDYEEIWTVLGWAQVDAHAAIFEHVTYEDRQSSLSNAERFMSRGQWPFGTARCYPVSVVDPLEAMRSLIAYRLTTHLVLRQEPDARRGNV